jgi:hypothetical protein
MGKRLNDTAAVIGITPYESQHEHYSRTVRKIDNGYVTSTYGKDPNDPASCGDGPTSKEVFTTSHPDHMDGEMSRNGSAMKRAVEFMKK